MMGKGLRLTFAASLLFLLLSACASPSLRPAGDVMTSPEINSDHILAGDGARLPLRTWGRDRENPMAVVIALHGFNDYGNFFKRTGVYLAERNITTYAYDQRGFGASPYPGYWAGIPTLTRDLETLAALVRQRHPGVPLYLFGESMGGAVVMVTAKQARERGKPLDIDGLVLSAPAVWGRVTMPWYQRLTLWVSAHVFPGANLTGRGLKIVPSDNIDMLIELGRDPLVIKKTRVDAVYGLTNLMDAALESAHAIEEPLLLLYGEKDEIIPKKPTELMISRLPETTRNSRKVIFYDNGYHMLIRDLQAEVVWNDINRWILNRSKGPGGETASGD